jgi:hypothetical protein
MRFLEWWFNRDVDQSILWTLIAGSCLGVLIAWVFKVDDSWRSILYLSGVWLLIPTAVVDFLLDMSGHIWYH